MKIFLLYFFILFPILYATPVKIASYNVENLFDDIYNGSEYDEYIPHKHNWDSKMFHIKLEHTAEVICDLDADIIGLQEIENKHTLNFLQKELKKVGCEYRYSAITTKKNAPIQVALLSKYLIRKQSSLQVSYSFKVRDILEVVVDINGYPLHIFVNHWKSKGRQGYESKRVLFAKRLKKRLERLSKNAEYVLLGDFNTNYDAYFGVDKKIDDTNGKVGLLDILPLKYQDRLADKSIVYKDSNYLYDLWLELPYAQRYSHKFYNHKSTLDHIIIPHSMFDGKNIDYVDNSFGVFRRGYLFKKDSINRWQIKNAKHIGKGYSDHLPIYALFDTLSFKKSKIDNNQQAKVSNIDEIYRLKKLQSPVILKDVVVILKRYNYAIIKQPNASKGIFVYGAKGLKEGISYDIQVNSTNIYHGLEEITSFFVLDRKSKIDLDRFYTKDIHDINGVIRDIHGVYNRGYLYTKNQKIAIYFKNRKLTPKNGTKIKIYYAHIGYYNKIQLVIYSKKDFIVE